MSLTVLCVPTDILLHQSGHIMLSDFDLAKQSGRPGGRPATVAQIEPNGVSPVLPFPLHLHPHTSAYNLNLNFSSDNYLSLHTVSTPEQLWFPE